MLITTKRKTLPVGKKTLIMGILNVTPDSFFDGGHFVTVSSAVQHAKKMLSEGADMIDIGGESTRPGADKVSEEVELERIIPVIEAIRKEIGNSVVLSIDTYKASVAKEAVEKGVDIINDVSGLQMDGDMAGLAAELSVPIIINHMRGIPKTMQDGEIVYDDVIVDIAAFFTKQIALLEKHGVVKENIILDPGFGFGKTPHQNLILLKRMGEFQKFNMPLMIGVSRKSSIGTVLSRELQQEISPEDRLEGSLAAAAVAVMNGAHIVRTHDVRETKKFVTMLDAIKNI